MSAMIPENPIKSALVQTFQERDTDIVRSQQQAQQAFQDEMTRRGHEVVHEAGETDQNGVDEDAQKQGGGKKKKRPPKGYGEEQQEELTRGWTMGPDDDGKPHKVNIIA